jgi:hypothetical protein
MRDGRRVAEILRDPSTAQPWLVSPLGRDLATAMDRGDVQAAAAFFEALIARDDGSRELRTTYERALDGWKEKRRRAMAALLPRSVQGDWADWEDRHPPPVSRLGRFLGRDEHRR